MGAEAETGQEKQGAEKPRPNSITPAQFLSWKRQKDADASARKAEAERKRAEDIASGAVQMNGRELFLHEPWVFDDARL
uniref:ZC3H15/TMA46 family C-terminal domain-containing protein n=1 Tax=Fagus sylvatica TaxID=28930 RepID=A0A2N9IL86_FAGSY